MSKGFVNAALKSPPQGLEDIITWLYTWSVGPRLLRRIMEDATSLLPHETSSAQQNSGEGNIGALSGNKVSAGAAVLLRRSLSSLEARLADAERENCGAR